MIGYKTINTLQDLENHDQEFEKGYKVLFLCEGDCGKKYLGASTRYEQVLYASTLENLEPNSSKCYSGSGTDWIEHKRTCNHKHKLTILDTQSDLKTHQENAIEYSYHLSSGNENVHVGDCEIFLNSKIESGVPDRQINIDEFDMGEYDVLNYVEDIPLEKVYVSETEINSANKSPEDVTIDNNLNETITRVFGSLSPREERVLRLRYGVGAGVRTSHTLSDIGESMNLNKTTIAIIEENAIKRLRHPSRSRKLSSFI
jgi:RNA polymerase sigma factor (sigma-70 family)